MPLPTPRSLETTSKRRGSGLFCAVGHRHLKYTARDRGFSPLGRGFLTGQIDANTRFAETDLRSIVPRFDPGVRHANLVLVERIRAIATRRGATPAQIALAWLLARQPWIVPIPGTSKLPRLEENLGAADLPLEAVDLRDIEAVLAEVRIEGERYPPQLARAVDR